MERITYFADVLLPLPVKGKFTYRVPFELNDTIQEGIRVVVQFGHRKIYTAIVCKLHEKPPKGYIPKYILSVLDDHPVVFPEQLDFWEWISSYYLCYPGEVMNAALPAAYKLASETNVALNPGFQQDSQSLTEKEYLLMEALHHRNKLKISEIINILDQQKIFPLIKTMIEKGMIVVEEELKHRFTPKMEVFVRLSGEYDGNEEALRSLFEKLEKRAGSQLEMLMVFLQLSDYGKLELKRTELLKKSSLKPSALDALVKKKVFEVKERIISRVETSDQLADSDDIQLTPIQSRALDEIHDGFAARDVVLLHGITSSGKTELYIKLIRETIDRGKQVLYLLPEIALTTQIINRLRKYYGEKVGVYHSRFNENEKVEIWQRVIRKSGDGPACFDIILGARSAVFLPFSDLGLVIVDEEHDASFKQTDPSPRYHGRDVAIYLARKHGAKVVLGSATPSMESYFNASQGKYALVEMKARYGQMELPLVRIVDCKDEMQKGRMKTHFSSVLLEQLEETLSLHEQSIIFQNRRGFSPRLECESCHWMPQCRNCDVTLVYHKKSNQLRCHYCGYVSRVPDHCPECMGKNLRLKGFGTEKVEEELGVFFPKAIIARMDLDTTRSRHAYQQILGDFGDRKIDILVGTQMVTKGLDFDHVSTVCILNADNMLSFPDFRATERSFQLMAQVSGRSGRKHKRGMVIIQTYRPDHPVLKEVVNNDYLSMYKLLLPERKKFCYPPFYRLILIKLKHKSAEEVNRASSLLASRLRKVFGKRVLGPEFPVVGRIMNYYIKQILLKIEKDTSVKTVKEKLMDEIVSFEQEYQSGNLRIILDVDPQ